MKISMLRKMFCCFYNIAATLKSIIKSSLWQMFNLLVTMQIKLHCLSAHIHSCESAVGQADRATVWSRHMQPDTNLVNLTTQTYTDTYRKGFWTLCVCVFVHTASSLLWRTLSNRLASMCLSSCCLQSAGILEVMSSGFCGMTGLTLMVSSEGFSGQVASV